MGTHTGPTSHWVEDSSRGHTLDEHLTELYNDDTEENSVRQYLCGFCVKKITTIFLPTNNYQSRLQHRHSKKIMLIVSRVHTAVAY